jgi:hypothetical protein
MNKDIVRAEYPRSVCVRRARDYYVFAWDAFFAVGPLLGIGRSADGAWESAARQMIPINTPKIHDTIRQCESFFGKHRKRR